MYYGDEKIRQMGRSILPATSKGPTEQARSIRRNARREIRQELSMLRGPADEACEIYDEFGLDYQRWPRAEINYWVRERRDHDKVNPVCHWADKISSHLDDPEERYRFVERRLGTETMISRHALSHVAFVLDYQENPLEYGLGRYGNPYYYGPDPDELRELTRERLQRAVDYCLGHLNACLKVEHFERWNTSKKCNADHIIRSASEVDGIVDTKLWYTQAFRSPAMAHGASVRFRGCSLEVGEILDRICV